jgi:hypothetical protein
MDLSSVLILPLSAMVAFIAVVGAASFAQPRPRLIWPFAISTFAAIPFALRLPSAAEIEFWAFVLLGLAPLSAVGTVIGAQVAKIVIKLVSSMSSR